MATNKDINDLWEIIARIEEKLAAQKEAVTFALKSSELAINKAETATEKRFDAVNEFRQTLADQQRTFMPRTEGEVRFAAIEEKINSIISSQTLGEGQRSGGDQVWGYIVAGAGVLVAIIALLMKK